MCFCDGRKIDYFYLFVNNILLFLIELFKQRFGYRSINIVKLCLVVFLELINKQLNLVVNSSIVKRFMKGIFNIKFLLLKYNNVWDVFVVLDYLEILMFFYIILFR